jgi:general secretion pathway protein K
MTPRQQQSGVALVTAILLVAIATALATKLAWDNQMSMRRTETILAMEQARMFALGAEAVAIDVLRQDDPAFDHAGEPWAMIVPPMEIGIEELSLGQMQGRISDAQGRFNLNNLVPPGNFDDTGEPSKPNETARKQFERLVDNLGLDRAIVDSVIDWIDSDTIPQPLGAEDGVYTAYDPPYRPANSYLTSISELRSIANIDAESYAILLPHVTALPPQWCGNQEVTAINMNSASAEVLMSIHEDITAGQAQAWVEERGDSGWEDWNEISEWSSEYAGLQGREVDIKSDCFGVNVLVNVGSSVLSMYSLLDRSANGDQILVRKRTFGLE